MGANTQGGGGGPEEKWSFVISHVPKEKKKEGKGENANVVDRREVNKRKKKGGGLGRNHKRLKGETKGLRGQKSGAKKRGWGQGASMQGSVG